jgi:hypothetical protein
VGHYGGRRSRTRGADRALYAAKAAGRGQIRFPPTFDAALRKIGAKADTPKREPLARSA